ncbi:DUF3611 family protein [Phormidesmis sp. 146-12]
MQTTESPALTAKLERVGGILRIVGWVGVWIDLAFTAAIVLLLLFAIVGRSFNLATFTIPAIPGTGIDPAVQGTTPGIGIGIFWAVGGLLVLLFSTFLAYRQTRFARRLRNPNPETHPPKGEVLQLLRLGALVGFVGMFVTIVGGISILSVLLAKTIALPQGAAIYAPTRMIRSIDIFVALANILGIAAHFAGTVASASVFEWLHRQ